MKSDDWRLTGQEEFLHNKTLIYCLYQNNHSSKSIHEHCIFCWHKFMEHCDNTKDCSDRGYCTKDKKYWICEECFLDFKEMFGWKLEHITEDDSLS